MRLGTKLAISFWVCTVTITALTVGFVYHEAISSIRKEVNNRLIDTVQAASHLIDPALHIKAASGNSKSQSYIKLRDKLDSFRQANPKIRHVYTLVQSSNPNELEYVMDVGVDPPLIAQIGCPWGISSHSNINNAFEKATVDSKIRRDKWGTWLSAYAPIRDAKQNTIAIVGVDMSVQEMLREEQSIRLATAGLMLAAILVATLVSILFFIKIARPITQLKLATKHIADGNFDYNITIANCDEFGSLAKYLNQMTANLKESQDNLLQRANTDGLTGLCNHRYFQERLGQELKRAVRYGHPLSLIMIDLDGFKSINDNLGHPAGDAILCNFSKILQEEIREIDIAARYGGDEFAVILPETGIDEAKAIGERIRAAVDQRPHLTDDLLPGEEKDSARNWKISLSVGVATCPIHARQRDALVSAADIAMYHAKHVSQNGVCTYDDVPGAGSTMDPCRIYTFLQSASVSTISALATAVDAKDHYTHGHSESVARYSVGIAAELQLSEEEKFNIRVAAMLHDVGKIGMPDSVLNNPGELDEYEWDIIRSHPSVGEKIVKQVPQLQRILPGILYHHERYDGTGYPCGLAGEKIPLIARIICVADAFDAMTSNRPYRNAMTIGQALTELQSCKGTQFDPACVDALTRWIRSTELQAA